MRVAAVALILLAALAIRLAFVADTPDFQLRHDAYDYDRHAHSIALGHGFSYSRRPDRPTAFRPPGYPYFLAGVYRLAGVTDAPRQERIEPARIANAVLSTAIVALIGVLAAQLWGFRVSLIAMALGAVYMPLVLIGGTVMSEPLFAVLLLGALTAALQHRRSAHRYRWALLAGVLGGLTVLTRANALVLLIPLAAAVWDVRPRLAWRSVAVPAMLVVTALLVVSPWTIRNAVVFGHFIPVSTQLGSALAGTYNDQAREDTKNPASWRSIRHIPSYRALWLAIPHTPEPVMESELRERSMEYIRAHPLYVGEVAFWSTARMLDLAGRDWSRHTAYTVGIDGGWADAGVLCFWAFAVLALAGCFTARARRTPWYVWAVPVLVYLSVVFLVVETPRYRTGIDPFVVLLAALAVAAGAERLGLRTAARG
jgi:4-amino-4-deoxy-L-arabinose transferase-like glycosyltransferase